MPEAGDDPMTARMNPRDDVVVEAREVAFEGYFRMDRYRLRHRRFAGDWTGTVTRELFERGHAAALLPYDPVNDTVVLIEQFRIGAYAAGLDPWLLEVVAGIIEPGEDPSDVVERESGEECGLAVTRLERIMDWLASPGGSSEVLSLYVGRVDTTDAGGLHGLAEENEDIRARVFSVDEALALLADNTINNATAIIALQWLARNRDALRRRWTDAG